MLFKLISSAGTGFSYVGKYTLLLIAFMRVGEKNIKYAARKMLLRKYDPIVNQYVLFMEQKLKK